MKKLLTLITILMALSVTGTAFAAECPGKEKRSGISCPGDKN